MALGHDTDESAWVAKYVSIGGTDHEARSLYQRMHAKVAPSPETNDDGHGSTGLKGLTHSSNGPSVTETPAKNAGQKSLPSPTPPAVEADLFGDTPPPKVARKTQDVEVHPDAPKKKRGRPPVNWSDRPKSQQELDLFELSLEIEKKNAKDHNQMGFIATAMIYASLPHSEIDGAVFKRKNGDLSLTILNDPDIGLPFGKIPRIITAFLCTEAKRHRDERGPNIELGKSQAEFAKKLGLNTGGGVRGDITRLKDQAKRLFTSHITLVGTPNSQFHWSNVNITDSGMLLWNPHDVNDRAPWESKLRLSDKFFNECIAHSVPIDLRVLHQLRSPLAIDIYIWMTYRYNSISGPTPISWKQLKWQFGANYAADEQGLKNFISNFKTQLRRVQAAYREAKFSVDQHKLTLHPSPPHILPPADRD